MSHIDQKQGDEISNANISKALRKNTEPQTYLVVILSVSEAKFVVMQKLNIMYKFTFLIHFLPSFHSQSAPMCCYCYINLILSTMHFSTHQRDRDCLGNISTWEQIQINSGLLSLTQLFVYAKLKWSLPSHWRSLIHVEHRHST